jgi:hypothetical protein
MIEVNKKNAHLLMCCVRWGCIIINYKNYHEGFYPQHHIKSYHSNCHLFEYIDIVIINIVIYIIMCYGILYIFVIPTVVVELYTYGLVVVYDLLFYFVVVARYFITFHFTFYV